MRDITIQWHGLPVTTVCPANAKTDEPQASRFGAWTGVAQGTIITGRLDPPTRTGTFGACTRRPLDNGHDQSSRPPDATHSTQQRRHVAAMRAVVTVSVAT